MKSIVLIGMPGAGKSTLGVLLSKALGIGFVDIDLLIQERGKRLLQDIIDSDGMEAFLLREQEAVLSFELGNRVIATGGSVVYKESSMRHLKTLGTIVYIHVDYDDLKMRLQDISTRGIAMAKGKTLRDIYEERLPLYKRYQDFSIDGTGLSMEESLKRLVDVLPRGFGLKNVKNS